MYFYLSETRVGSFQRANACSKRGEDVKEFFWQLWKQRNTLKKKHVVRPPGFHSLERPHAFSLCTLHLKYLQSDIIWRCVRQFLWSKLARYASYCVNFFHDSFITSCLFLNSCDLTITAHLFALHCVLSCVFYFV